MYTKQLQLWSFCPNSQLVNSISISKSYNVLNFKTFRGLIHNTCYGQTCNVLRIYSTIKITPLIVLL